MPCKKRPTWELLTVTASRTGELAAALRAGWEPYAVDPVGGSNVHFPGPEPLHYLKRRVACTNTLHAHVDHHVEE